jgi:hypothetical protein
VFDFRYHALSLVAVFLALAIGVLLGVVIGDAGLVSSAKRDIEASLHEDVKQARAESDRLRGEIRVHQRFEQAVQPLLVGGQLTGRRIGLVFLGPASDETVREVQASIASSGGRLTLVAVAREPLDLAAVAGRAGSTRYAALEGDATLVKPFGRRIGVQLVRGGALLRAIRPALLRVTGTLGPVDAVVVMRDANTFDDEAQRTSADAFEAGFAEGLNAAGVPAVGVETTKTSPSQIGWYRDHDLASVDNLDQVGGQAALVFTLAGADGAYGVKSTAQAQLPAVVGGVRQP